jgi:hypothetical protein
MSTESGKKMTEETAKNRFKLFKVDSSIDNIF